MSYDVAGGSATVLVTTSTGCTWTASSQATWIGAAGSGSGSGSIVVSVASNDGGARSGNATVAGIAVSVSQKGRSEGPRTTQALTHQLHRVPAGLHAPAANRPATRGAARR